MREAEEKEEENECEGGTKCVKERMKHVRGVNNNRTKHVSWPMDMTRTDPISDTKLVDKNEVKKCMISKLSENSHVCEKN